MKKNAGVFFSTLIFCFFISNDLWAQSDEVAITAASQKAKNFFLQGRDYLENLENNTAILLFNKAIEMDPKFAMAYLYRSQSGGGYNIFRKNLEKAVKLSEKVTQGERLNSCSLKQIRQIRLTGTIWRRFTIKEEINSKHNSFLKKLSGSM